VPAFIETKLYAVRSVDMLTYQLVFIFLSQSLLKCLGENFCWLTLENSKKKHSLKF